MHRIGSQVFEIALTSSDDAFRVEYAVQLADAIWAIHAFQKKSTQGIKTPQREVDLVVDRVEGRLKRMKESLR
jgi:phage-related protein